MALLTKLFTVLVPLTFMAYVALSVPNRLVLVLVVSYTSTNYFFIFLLLIELFYSDYYGRSKTNNWYEVLDC